MFLSRFSPRLRRLLVLALFASSVATGAFAADRAQVTLLATTDLHGHLLPLDDYTGQPSPLGVAKLATLIAQARRNAPDLLLIDSGDTIQGTPLAYFHARKNNAPPDPMMLAMNALQYTSMTVGNHEYNFGPAVLAKARGEAHFPWLSANTYRTGTDETAYAPYVVKEVAGVRIGILGLTTPGIPYWENPENYAGLEFRPLLSEAKKWTTLLRSREHVDAVVIAMHGGLEEDLATGRRPPGNIPGENAAVALAREVPGLDVILLGHTHREVPALVVNGVLLTQAGHWGDFLARVDLYFSRPSTDAPWTLLAKGAHTIPVRADTPADPAILAIAAPYQRETQAWLTREIGTCAQPLGAEDAQFRDTALLDLVQRAQLEAGHADVSLAASFNRHARIAAGPVTVRDIASLYPYENTLYVLEVTGAQLKAALEHSARYFLPYVAGKSPAELVDPSIPAYNFDVAEGVSYEIDLRRPIGDRIQHLTFQGAPLAPDRKLRLATNNYRYNGGGGYTMLKTARVLAHPSAEIRDLLIAWVERHHDIPVTPTGNWRLVP
ncbi:bifunctional metallophosphatase/5'-nucleotidase [Horticoccus luteus]|uniref:Bifunctional metallophosphatase/5'-nucleotidase n=1 Tax=Horticoccus luteus TaxID=2862869 RepID=A0A8F9XJ60_9BACT|nr:bifunctional UDP-sugar hydrolase/5'-nucleotidase [Horticoccus luteus]QYM78323.1 bifunctional metallophosphatase/5'-nucleotidase [Horticoccus luteus]